MDKKVIAFEQLPEERISEKTKRRSIHGEKGTLARFEFSKGAVIPRHQHPNEQIVYILSGSVRITVEGKEHILKKGDVLIIPSNTFHALEALEDAIDIEFFSPPRQDWLPGL